MRDRFVNSTITRAPTKYAYMVNYYTLAEAITRVDPFQAPDCHGHTRNFNPAFVSTTLRINGF